MKVVVSTLALAVVTTATGCSPAPRTEQPRTQSPVMVRVDRARMGDMAAWHEVGGIVRSRRTALIASRVMAPVTVVRVRPGDRVRQGDILLTLDRRDRQADATRQAAAMTAAREAVLASEADARAAEAAAVLARVTHDRMATLHARRSATTQELDRATAERQATEAQVASAQARLRAAKAALEGAQATADITDVGLSDTTLTAPFEGVVTERRVDPGTLAVPGAPLLVLDSADGHRLEADVDEARAALLTVGQRVDVRLDATSTDWLAATVSEVARIDPASHAFLVKADLPAGVKAPSGSFGRLRFAGTARRTLSVPASAIVRRGPLTFVFIVKAEGEARLTAVTIGPTIDDSTEVLAGIRDSDTVVLAPPPGLADGTTVQVSAGERR